MRLALIGYGKMGREIERLAVERSISVPLRVDVEPFILSTDDLRGIDIAIHFATPNSVLSRVQQLAEHKKNIVIGTTGWQNDFDAVRSIVASKHVGVVYASNFSIGVNILLRLVKDAGLLFNNFGEYDVFIHEVHHKDKLDSPSGTALTLAEQLLSTVKRKKAILDKPSQGRIQPEQLHVSSTRAGAVVGRHQVTFDSVADSIDIIHTAKNRTGFALGALLAAEWVQGKQGMFTMDDVLADILKK